MNLLSDIITYVRRIIKSPSDAEIKDDLIIDYINRFWIMDVDARMQLFDLKTTYSFQTQPGVDKYNMPLYSLQTEPGGQTIGSYPVYQGFTSPVFVKGVAVPLFTERSTFFNAWPNYQQTLTATAIGNGTMGPYTFQLPFQNNPPVLNNSVYCLRGHVDMAGIMATGSIQDPPLTSSFIPTIPTTSVQSAVYITTQGSNGANVIVQDSGQFLSADINEGLLMAPGAAPLDNQTLGAYGIGLNTVNYSTGSVNVTFLQNIPDGQNINAQCYFFSLGLPRGLLYYNNTITLRSPPDQQYLVELDAYLTPAAFLSTGAAIPFGYMAEYIARGAARKILSDTGDAEQFMFYEPLFREQELLVWKRSQRQFTATRTQTLYSQGLSIGNVGNNIGQSN
jgi:hypothetical protein